MSAIDSSGANRAGGLGFNADDNVVYLANGGTQCLNIDNAGNASIGTNSPDTRLHIQGSDFSSSSFTLYRTM